MDKSILCHKERMIKTDCTSNILNTTCYVAIRLFQDLFENTSVDINELTL